MTLLKQSLKKILLPAGLIVAGTTGGFFVSQKLALSRARKQADAPFYEVYASRWGEISFRSYGHGYPILLVHSMMLGASKKEWSHVAQELSKLYCVYTIDLPGFGQSPSPDKPWSAYQYALLINAFVTEVIKQPACLIGANGGGDLILSAKALGNPLIEKLVLLSPEGFGKGFAKAEDVAELKKLMSPLYGTQLFLGETSPKKILARLSELFVQQQFVTEQLAQDISVQARAGDGAQTTFTQLATGFWRGDTIPAFCALNIPYLLIWGEGNKENPVANLETVETQKDYGEFAIFEETGAFPHIENSKQFTKEVIEFLK